MGGAAGVLPRGKDAAAERERGSDADVQVCSELWVVGSGAVKRFRGDFKEYKRAFLSGLAANTPPPVPSS